MRSQNSRSLHIEDLETRSMLSVDLMALDINRDGAIAASDAVMVINRIGSYSVEVDVDADGQVSPRDVHAIINQVIRTPNSPLSYGTEGTAGDDHIDVPGEQAHEISLRRIPFLLSNDTWLRGLARGRLETAGDVDVQQITVGDSIRELKLRSATVVPGGLSIRLLDESGSALATGDDRLDVPLTTGTYFLEVSAQDANATGWYGMWLTAVADPAEDDDHGNDPQNATDMEFFSLFRRHVAATRGALNAPGDVDVFSFTMEEGDTLKMFALSRVEIDIEITDTSGNVLFRGREFEDGSVDLAAGEYFVAVSAANGTETGFYGLTLRI